MSADRWECDDCGCVLPADPGAEISCPDCYAFDRREQTATAAVEHRPVLHCPNCQEKYVAEYADPDDAPPQSIGREQHMSGICSDECWNEYLGESL